MLQRAEPTEEAFQLEGIKVEIAEQLAQAMARQQINNVELARRSGKSPAYINKLLRGGANFTLEALVKIARALSYQIELTLKAAPAVTKLPEQASAPRTSPTAGSDTLQRHLAAAEHWAAEMAASAQTGNLLELSNAGFALGATLDELWALRGEREADWGDLLNLLQGALAKEEFERYSAPQCAAIGKIIRDHLAADQVELDDLEHSIGLLREAGLDPWKGISGNLSE